MLRVMSTLVNKRKDPFLPTLFKSEFTQNEHAQCRKAVNSSQVAFCSNWNVALRQLLRFPICTLSEISWGLLPWDSPSPKLRADWLLELLFILKGNGRLVLLASASHLPPMGCLLLLLSPALGIRLSNFCPEFFLYTCLILKSPAHG